jgi:hypothetical protein
MATDDARLLVDRDGGLEGKLGRRLGATKRLF